MDTKYFRSNVVYQIYPRSFCDSNGDGIGDIPGITSKLDYLLSLGIGIIWLSPVYKSPNCDYGYDISDYMGIQPEYGTMKDMDNLILEAKKRGIRIVMDLVVNHTSDEHPWFVASRDPKSPYHAYYYWRKGKNNNTEPPNNWTSDFGGSAWEYDKEVGEWYLHLFSKKQVDLDWHNPAVLVEVEKILRFWLDKGIYGFRCDVINQIWKEDLNDAKKSPYVRGLDHYLDKDGNHKILERFHDDVFSHYDCMTVGETYNVDFPNARRFTNGHELDMVFQFDTMNIDKGFVPVFNVPYKPRKLKKSLFTWQRQLDWNANYFENHDQRRSIERFGDAKKYWKESGKMLATILMTLRGTPYVYEGEEIGMLNLPVVSKEDYRDPVNNYIYSLMRGFHLPNKLSLKLVANYSRDNARTPMQWSEGSFAGFSKSQPWIKLNDNFKTINVKKEEDDPTSILSFYKQAIAVRKREVALNFGSLEEIKTPSSIMAYMRSYEGQMILVVANLTGHKHKIPKKLQSSQGKVILANYDPVNNGTQEGTAYAYKKHLRPYEALVVKM
jgi:oligo-1,6-glucosidase